MLNIGVPELMVLAIVGLIVLGPDRLPGLARDAAQMIRTLRELATGARQQLRDELGPEFADIDLRNLNPRTAVQRAVFGDDFDLGRLNPRTAIRDAILGDEDLQAADPRASVREAHDEIRGRADATAGLGVDAASAEIATGVTEPSIDLRKPVTRSMSAPAPGRPRPRPRPAGPDTPYDADAT